MFCLCISIISSVQNADKTIYISVIITVHVKRPHKLFIEFEAGCYKMSVPTDCTITDSHFVENCTSTAATTLKPS